MVNEEEIRILQNFRKMLNDYFNGNYGDGHQDELKSAINKKLHITQELVARAGCLKTMTMAPPPMIGGAMIRNFNPFDMLFTDFYGSSIIPDVIGIIDQAIGKYEAGLVKFENDEKSKTKKDYKGEPPAKITLSWLSNHVPASMWWSAIVFLAGSFGLGVAFCKYILK
ncbi:hypothetical protein PF327_09915 [Sulfurovum sp. XTW-4]|uniref:Uncharacterized protein n=1 Tax=Sulfurovum xiamenensis TaxID=3019066 RepID=A0ABT7QTV0_9BACT|nr:hypothetical protein [Sulfurovum xiamenensis]MDM5264511.1 hypothetical protein [Sulfurovum xiamenensis]